ncbi:hypothetical protein N7G274_005341 [Stereocaulon virgatum]|uniref:Uncharacterized protein n=1 Tax=Stereocaulon virgatum TaxID=373712 RepID=A0ABR4AAS6_9LECA
MSSCSFLTSAMSLPPSFSQHLLNLSEVPPVYNNSGKLLTRSFPSSLNAAHMHPPLSPGQVPPQGPPGALPPGAPGPTDPMAINHMNEMYMQQRQDVNNRLEADSRGYETVFSQ